MLVIEQTVASESVLCKLGSSNKVMACSHIDDACASPLPALWIQFPLVDSIAIGVYLALGWNGWLLVVGLVGSAGHCFQLLL